MLFGAGGTAEERAARRRTQGSILDWITGRIADIQRDLKPSDRQRMDQYLQNIREIERRIQRIEAQNTSGEPRELPGAPPGVPDSFEEHMRLMFDLQVLAFESDMTRVFSFKTGRDASARVYPESGTTVSHHGNNPQNILAFNMINRHHVAMFPYFLDKLKATLDGDTSLIDKTMIIYGSPMGDGHVHNHRRCPFIVMGGANGQLQGGLHLK